MSKLFAVVAGARLAGKSTLAGTLPGSTLMLQAAVKETGSRSAKALARKLGNNLKVDTFLDLQHLRAEVEKQATSKEYDHLYIDGFSAINDMNWSTPAMQAAFMRDQWPTFNKHGQDMKAFLEWLKSFVHEPFGKNVFLTCALKVKDGGEDVELECKGKVAVTEITRLGEAVLTLMEVPAEDGAMRRVMLTKNYLKWPGRIDGVLDEDNPGYMEPNLGGVLALLGEHQ